MLETPGKLADNGCLDPYLAGPSYKLKYPITHRMEPVIPGWKLRSGKKGGRGVGVTRRGKGTKLSLVVDGNGVPLAATVASAQDHDIRLAKPTVSLVRVPGLIGRPRTRLNALAADKGYDSRPFRNWLAGKGTVSRIPFRAYPNRTKLIKRQEASSCAYSDRWRIERSFAWLQTFRRLTVRWDRSLVAYHGFLSVACIIICLRKFN
jgi:transposase